MSGPKHGQRCPRGRMGVIREDQHQLHPGSKSGHENKSVSSPIFASPLAVPFVLRFGVSVVRSGQFVRLRYNVSVFFWFLSKLSGTLIVLHHWMAHYKVLYVVNSSSFCLLSFWNVAVWSWLSHDNLLTLIANHLHKLMGNFFISTDTCRISIFISLFGWFGTLIILQIYRQIIFID